MKYLLDTNILSEAVKTVPDKSVMLMLEKCQHEIVTAAPVWHELPEIWMKFASGIGYFTPNNVKKAGLTPIMFNKHNV